GQYGAGDALPAGRLLAKRFRANRRTIRVAVEQQATEGLISLKTRRRPIISGRFSQETAMRSSRVRRPTPPQFVALIMWHGVLHQGATAQQQIFWGMNGRLANAGYHGVFLDLGEIGTEQENAAREAACLQYALD